MKPWQHEQWCIPEASAAFVAAMEDVLDLYAQPYDSAQPVVCLDEKPVALHTASRPLVPATPGQVERRDYEYVRQGTAAVFVLVEPLGGWRHYAPGSRRTTQDYAAQLRYLADGVYPDAQVIRLVQDNLNTHGPAALYAAFAPEEARRLRQRFEFHYTPKHGSWLNMAEIEISVLARGCLGRPCPDLATLSQRATALETERNAHHRTITWQFTTTEARSRLHRLYPDPKIKLD
ncbi:MAG: IS630 family transposase [Ktedonobacteraceae bacterium]